METQTYWLNYIYIYFLLTYTACCNFELKRKSIKDRYINMYKRTNAWTYKDNYVHFNERFNIETYCINNIYLELSKSTKCLRPRVPSPYKKNCSTKGSETFSISSERVEGLKSKIKTTRNRFRFSTIIFWISCTFIYKILEFCCFLPQFGTYWSIEKYLFEK